MFARAVALPGLRCCAELQALAAWKRPAGPASRAQLSHRRGTPARRSAQLNSRLSQALTLHHPGSEPLLEESSTILRQRQRHVFSLFVHAVFPGPVFLVSKKNISLSGPYLAMETAIATRRSLGADMLRDHFCTTSSQLSVS